jgi:hypothetical protein
VEEQLLGGWDDQLRLRMMVAAQYDAPAYIRRARAVEAALNDLLERCRRQRADWLYGVRLHLGALRAGVESWSELGGVLADDEQVAVLERLRCEAGDPAVPTDGPTTVTGRRRLLRRLQSSIERFNRRWSDYVEDLDLSEINRLRDGYNRFYLLEKECAVGPGRILTQAFCRLPPLTARDLLEHLPRLPAPQMAE